MDSLRIDHLFEKIKIKVQQTDKMTENRQHAFVKNNFYSIDFDLNNNNENINDFNIPQRFRKHRKENRLLD